MAMQNKPLGRVSVMPRFWIWAVPDKGKTVHISYIHDWTRYKRTHDHNLYIRTLSTTALGFMFSGHVSVETNHQILMSEILKVSLLYSLAMFTHITKYTM